MVTATLSMMPQRFECLSKFYSESKIKILKKDEEFVTFEIIISDPFDVLEIFHSGTTYGINIMVPGAK